MIIKRKIEMLEVAGKLYENTTDVGLYIAIQDGKYGLVNEERRYDWKNHGTSFTATCVVEFKYDSIFELCTSHFIVIQSGQFGLVRVRDKGLNDTRELLMDFIAPAEYEYISLDGAIMLHKNRKVRFYNQRTGFMSDYFDCLCALDDYHLTGVLGDKEVFVDLLSDIVIKKAENRERGMVLC